MKNKLIIWLIAVGLGIAYLGIKSENPIVIGLLLGGLGLFGIFSGIQMIITKRADVPTSDSFDSYKERHTGFTAQLWGVLFIVMGLLSFFIGLGMSVFRDRSQARVEGFLSTSSGFGMLMATAGGAILVFGLIRLISGNAPYVETKLVPFERIAGGIYFSLFGAGIFGIGLWLILSPSTLKALFDFLTSLIVQLISG